MIGGQTVRYGYNLIVNGKSQWVGYYQCDCLDFKKMWSRLRRDFDVRVCYVYLYVGKELSHVYSWVNGIGWREI